LDHPQDFPPKNHHIFLSATSTMKPLQVKAKVRAEIFAALDDEKVEDF
jgi:hypothetical protein